MWETVTGWFVNLFNYLRPQRADFEAMVKTQNEVIAHQTGVIESMQGRIDTMDREFKQAMDRRDSEIDRLVQRVSHLEESEEKCRKALAGAEERIRLIEEEAGRALRIEQDRNQSLRRKLNEAKKALAEVQRAKKLQENPVYQDNTLAQTKMLTDRTKLDVPPDSE